MLLSDINGKAEVVPGYWVAVDPGDYYLIELPYLYDHAGHNYAHENMAARLSRVFDFKHDNPKRWSQKAGVGLIFVLPKDKIRLSNEAGHSYPKVIIGLEKIQLSTSGGGDGKTWCDNLRDHGHVTVNPPKKVFQAIAKAAVQPIVLSFVNYRRDMRRLCPQDQLRWQALALMATCRQQLQQGQELYTTENVSFGGEYGPFAYERHDRATIRAKAPNALIKAKPSDIDWRKVAEVNQWHVPTPVAENYVGNVIPSWEEEREAFFAHNKGKLISCQAWSHDFHKAVPQGMVGVLAKVDGDRGQGTASYWLVPEEEYAQACPTWGVVIDTSRHQPWQGPK